MLCRIADGVSLLFKNRFSEKPLRLTGLLFSSESVILQHKVYNLKSINE